MDQKTIAKVPIKKDRAELIQETQDQAFFEPKIREVDLVLYSQNRLD